MGENCNLSEPWLVQLFMKGLGPDFEVFITSFNTSHQLVGTKAQDDMPAKAPISFNFVVNTAAQHEKRTGKAIGLMAGSKQNKISSVYNKPGHGRENY